VLAIHHQRIEYPETADLSREGSANRATAITEEMNDDSGVITLDLPPREADSVRAGAIPFRMESGEDYESADLLPDESFGLGDPDAPAPTKES
jgi:hypothetical protein